jgi:adenylate cyclase
MEGTHRYFNRLKRSAVNLAWMENRVDRRRRVLQAGTIEFDSGAIDCTVRNLASTGARFEVGSTVGIQAEFTLMLRDGHVAPVPVQGHFWEVDLFFGDNAGLVFVEIELDSVDEAFVKPTWIVAEVTSHASYYNGALANNPFSAWADGDHRSA